MVAVGGDDLVAVLVVREQPGGDRFLPAVEVEVAADLALPEAALARPPRRGGSRSSSGRDRAIASVSRAWVRLPLRDGAGRPGLPRSRPRRCGYGSVVLRRRLSPSALTLRCRHALASRASGGSRPWSRRGYRCIVPWGGTRSQAAAPPRSFAELYRTARTAPGVARTSRHGQHDSCRPARRHERIWANDPANALVPDGDRSRE